MSLSREEARWLSRNIIKTLTILMAAGEKTPAIRERVTFKTLNSLKDTAQDLADQLLRDEALASGFDFQIKKKQKTIVRQLIENTLIHLGEKILPEYRNRNLTVYIEDTEDKVEMLKGLKRKLK